MLIQEKFFLFFFLNRNSSGLVSADIRLTFSEQFHIRHTNYFYSFLSENERLGSMPISVINDTSKLNIKKGLISPLQSKFQLVRKITINFNVFW